MTRHRWRAVAIVPLDEDDAALIATMDTAPRLQALRSRIERNAQTLADVVVVRGPICSECRVAWEDVHAESEPWPCPGRRPDELGGPLTDPTASRLAPNRQQRRARGRTMRRLAGSNAADSRAPILEHDKEA